MSFSLNGFDPSARSTGSGQASSGSPRAKSRGDRLATAGRIFLIFGLVLALIFSYAHPSPAYAIDIVGGWNNLNSWANGFWTAISCGTDVHCWIRNTGSAGASYGVNVVTGTDIEKIRGAASLPEAFANGYGLIGTTGTLIGGVYENPANIHFATFFEDKLANNLLASPAYATTGTAILGPIYGAWGKLREIAYALFIVIVAVIALMIMLQKQIAPRVVVTVTNALPKMFMALVLITLSYPIAALFIDVFAVWLPAVLNDFFNFNGILDALLQSVYVMGEAAIKGSFGWVFTGSSVAILLAVVLGAVAAASAVVTGGAAVAGLAVLFLILFVAIIALIILGAVFLQLLYRYTRLIILTALGPLILLLGALPGQEGVTTGWFKDLLANALAFPVILFAFYLSVTLLQTAEGVPESTEALRSIPGLGAAGVLVGGLIVPLAALMVLLFAIRAPGFVEGIIKGKGRR